MPRVKSVVLALGPFGETGDSPFGPQGVKTVSPAGQQLVGFAVETDNELAEARRKLTQKHLDLVVVNNPTTPGAGFDVDTNVVTLVSAAGEESLPLQSKDEVAEKILMRARALWAEGEVKGSG